MYALSQGKYLATVLTVPPAPYLTLGRLVLGNEDDMGSSYQNGHCITAQRVGWEPRRQKRWGRVTVSDVGRGGRVAASATLTPVEMGASAVIEDAGLVVDSIHDNGGERTWSCVDDDDAT